MLLGCGADVEELDGDGRTPLVHAAVELQEPICEILLEHGASTDSPRNSSNLKGCTHRAIDSRAAISMIHLLVKLGADLEEPGVFRVGSDLRLGTPLLSAASQGTNWSAALIQLLLDNGANIAARCDDYQGSVLHYAVHAGISSIEGLKCVLNHVDMLHAGFQNYAFWEYPAALVCPGSRRRRKFKYGAYAYRGSKAPDRARRKPSHM